MEDKSDNLLFRTDENGDRVRKSYKGKNNPRYGAKLTDETKKKISKGNRGKKRSKESIRKQQFVERALKQKCTLTRN